MSNLIETITTEADLLAKLRTLPEAEVFNFMKNLRSGTFFNMGMYSSIAPKAAYKSTYRIYKVQTLQAIVSGVDYENIKTTQDFRAETGEVAKGGWYDHMPGYEHKVGLRKKDHNDKYVLWNYKASGSKATVSYFLVDLATGKVDAISKEDLESSVYLTDTEKGKLQPKHSVGYSLTTGDLIENKTNWRTVKFENIFWLSQKGIDYGVRFEEALEGANLKENSVLDTDGFIDTHAHVGKKLDSILSGEIEESIKTDLNESDDFTTDFVDKHAHVEKKLDRILSGSVNEGRCAVKESYRRTVSRGLDFVDNELFVDFD
jgi:hypothetical protein